MPKLGNYFRAIKIKLAGSNLVPFGLRKRLADTQDIGGPLRARETKLRLWKQRALKAGKNANPWKHDEESRYLLNRRLNMWLGKINTAKRLAGSDTKEGSAAIKKIHEDKGGK